MVPSYLRGVTNCAENEAFFHFIAQDKRLMPSRACSLPGCVSRHSCGKKYCDTDVMEPAFPPARLNSLIGQSESGVIDYLARTLAERAGADWSSLHPYPGYERNRWREEAQRAGHLA
jgi:hypothetical protein